MVSILQHPVIASMLTGTSVRTYKKGETILSPKEVTDYLFVVKAGAVTMHDLDSQDNQKILHIFGPGTLFPMTSFTDSLAISAWWYTTLIDTEVYAIPYTELRQRLEDSGSVDAYNLLLRQLLDEVHELLLRICNMTKTDRVQKLTAALEFLGNYHAKPAMGGWKQITFPVTHRLLADMTGLTRETVTLALKQFQEKGAVRYPSLATLELNMTHLKKL